jgi:Putative DNA-binding domain
MIDILKDNWLNEFFSVVDNKNILKRRETYTIEFKEEFDWKKGKSGYCKSLAAFANNKGGAIFFGIQNTPHKIVGITNFEEIDDADISNFMTEIFSPNIIIERRIYEYKKLKIGIIYAFKSVYKPIICCKDSEKTISSDIYFRYSAKSSKIKSGDLLKLMEEIRTEESVKWMKLFENIGKIGVQNVHLLNAHSGEIISNNNTFLLDEALLEQIKIIDRYSEREDGQPAVKIIGEIPELARVITKTSSLYERDIYTEFLSDNAKINNIELLTFICSQSVPNYPIYFLLLRLEYSMDTALGFIDSLKIPGKGRKALSQRLKIDNKCGNNIGKYTLGNNSKFGAIRANYLNNLSKNIPQECFEENNVKRLLEATFSLIKGSFDYQFVKSQMSTIFEKCYPFENSSLNYLFRDSVTFLDYLENRIN